MDIKDNTISISVGTITKVIVIGLLFWVFFLLRDLILVVLLSIVVASGVEPGAQWFVKRGVPRLFAVITIYLTIAVCLIGFTYFLLVPILSESGQFLRNFPVYFSESNINNFTDTIASSDFLPSQSFVEGITNSINLEDVIGQINTIIGSISSNAFGTVATFFGGIMSFFLAAILSFYLSVEEDGVEKFLKAITTIKHENYVVSLWKRSQKKIGLWMQGQLVLAIIIGMLVYLGLLILKVPNPLLLATMAAFFEIIPLFGPILASIPAIMISFVTGGLPLSLMVLGLYIIVHQFENQLIYPLVVKKVVGVSPVVSILALTAGWQLAGFLGIILSVPVAAAITEFFDDFQKNKVEKMMNQG